MQDTIQRLTGNRLFRTSENQVLPQYYTSSLPRPSDLKKSMKHNDKNDECFMKTVVEAKSRETRSGLELC